MQKKAYQSLLHTQQLSSQTESKLLQNKLALTSEQLTSLQKDTDFERKNFQSEITKLLQDSKAQDIHKDSKLEQAREQLLDLERKLVRKDAELDFLQKQHSSQHAESETAKTELQQAKQELIRKETECRVLEQKVTEMTWSQLQAG